eukprot:scaffold18570_cov89-Cylindrotheca_fusiformis.AAC.4
MRAGKVEKNTSRSITFNLERFFEFDRFAVPSSGVREDLIVGKWYKLHYSPDSMLSSVNSDQNVSGPSSVWVWRGNLIRDRATT